MKKGKLIVIEGACDGIGKSTQSALLQDRLINDGYVVKKHHFPSYGTDQGKTVENYLKGKYGTLEDVGPYFINSLFAMDRAITWHTELKHSYESGEITLLDRYTTSSLIYQLANIESLEERKKIAEYVLDFEYNKLGIKVPDSIIFLTADFDLVTDLRNQRDPSNSVDGDIHEKNMIYMKKVYENAQYMAELFGWDKVTCSSNDEMFSKEDIHEKVYKKVMQTIKE